MRYTLLLHHIEATPDEIGEAEWAAAEAAFAAYIRDLDESRVLVAAEVLQPVAHSTTLTLRDGSLRVQDGPFAETKEQLGGLFVIEVPDLDAALAWAEKCPAARWGTIEIRPTALHGREGRWVAPE
ncbi:MAG TPA: YciI family protein [Pseudomonadales bacterium]